MSNDFLPFAGGVGANVVSQADYAALTSVLANGFQAGTAYSNQLNKVWRQSSTMSAVLAQFIADTSSTNAVDDGTTATLLANLKAGINTMIATGAKSVVISAVTFAPAVNANGQAVYWDQSNTRFDLALADGTSKQNVVGLADVTNSRVYMFGDTILLSGLTPGSRYYLSGTTAGAVTVTAPTNIVSIGIAKIAAEMFIDIDPFGALAIGKHTIWIPATAMTSRTTNGSGAGIVESDVNKVMLKTQDFDAATAEYAQFTVRMPKGWNEGTLTAYVLWSNASGTGNVVWGLQAVALSDDDVLDAAFGAAQTVTDGVTAAGDLMQSEETSAITIAGTPAANDLIVFQAYRDAANGSDTLAVDARLHGVVVIYTTDAATDA